jgi:hypothetical protein
MLKNAVKKSTPAKKNQNLRLNVSTNLRMRVT